MQRIKCVVVGAESSGKTALVRAYLAAMNPGLDFGLELDAVSENVMVDGQPFHLCIHDTSQHDHTEALRPLAYPDADVIVCCFSITDISSFEKIRATFYPELRRLCPAVPLILVGTNADLRFVPEECTNGAVSHDQGLLMLQEIGASMYVECSFRDAASTKEVFVEAIRAATSQTTRTTPT